MDTWTLPKAAEDLNIKVGRLREWVDRGHIKPARPAKRKEESQRTQHQFELPDLYKIKLFQYLLNRGFYRKQASKIALQYRDEDFLAVSKTGERLTFNWYKKGDSVPLKNEDDILLVNLDKIRKSIKVEAKKVKVIVS